MRTTLIALLLSTLGLSALGGSAYAATDREIAAAMRADGVQKMEVNGATFLKKRNGTVYKLASGKPTKRLTVSHVGLPEETTFLDGNRRRILTERLGYTLDRIEIGAAGKRGFIELSRDKTSPDAQPGPKGFSKALLVEKNGDWYHVGGDGRVVRGMQGAELPSEYQAPESARGGRLVVGSLPAGTNILGSVRSGSFKKVVALRTPKAKR